MRPETLARYAEEGGFHAVEILPIAHAFPTLDRLRL
jgi:hypothetical protein